MCMKRRYAEAMTRNIRCIALGRTTENHEKPDSYIHNDMDMPKAKWLYTSTTQYVKRAMTSNEVACKQAVYATKSEAENTWFSACLRLCVCARARVVWTTVIPSARKFEWPLEEIPRVKATRCRYWSPSRRPHNKLEDTLDVSVERQSKKIGCDSPPIVVCRLRVVET